MAIDKTFKRALSNLPDREKDKLVLKLVRRDHKIARRLHYELIGDFSKEDLRDDFFENTIRELERIKRSGRYKPGYLSMVLRSLSGDIASYLFTTKDKYGEALMNLYLLNKVFESFSEDIDAHYQTTKGNKLAVYLVNKAFNTRILIHKLDADHYIDFRDDLIQLGRHFGNNHGIMDTSIYHGFDVNWLMNEDIPEDIEERRKELRKRGYLKQRAWQ
ncbi:MAG: hypothetical protein ACQERC_00670 [Bacteroidota bacterium]